MIKLEKDLLILDAPLSKQDAEAVTEFVGIVRKQQTERIIKLLEDEMATLNEQLAQWSEPAWHRYKALEQAIELIKRESK